jgi:hypothetical protein
VDLIDISSNAIKPNMIFNINSDSSLQLVITRTFLSLITSIVKVFTGQQAEGNNLTNKQESTSFIKISDLDSSNKISNIDTDLLKNESEEEDALCSFLIKNELGVDILLNAVNGLLVIF